MNRFSFTNHFAKLERRLSDDQIRAYCFKIENKFFAYLDAAYVDNIKMVQGAQQVKLTGKGETPQSAVKSICDYLEKITAENRLFYFIHTPAMEYRSRQEYVCTMTIGQGNIRFVPTEEPIAENQVH
jgi:hypothetical protein